MGKAGNVQTKAAGHDAALQLVQKGNAVTARDEKDMETNET